jgi:hypothetical protein
VQAIAALRRLRFTGPEIAEVLGMAVSTVSGLPLRRRRKTKPQTAAPAGWKFKAEVRRGQNRSGQMAQPSWKQTSRRV